jgi:hypothetical protein
MNTTTFEVQAPPSAVLTTLSSAPGPQPSIRARDVIGESWQRTKSQIPTVLGACILFSLPGIPLALFAASLSSGIPADAAAARSFIDFLAAVGLGTVGTSALTRLAINAARGQASVTDCYTGLKDAPLMLPFVLASSLVGVFGAFALKRIPVSSFNGLLAVALASALVATVFSIAISYVPFAIAEKQEDLLPSMSKGLRLAFSNCGFVLRLALASALVTVLGFASCGVGLFFAMPLVLVAHAVAYLKMSEAA